MGGGGTALRRSRPYPRPTARRMRSREMGKASIGGASVFFSVVISWWPPSRRPMAMSSEFEGDGGPDRNQYRGIQRDRGGYRRQGAGSIARRLCGCRGTIQLLDLPLDGARRPERVGCGRYRGMYVPAVRRRGDAPGGWGQHHGRTPARDLRIYVRAAYDACGMRALAPRS